MSTAPESEEERCARLKDEHVEAVFAPYVRAALLALDNSPPCLLPPALRMKIDDTARSR